MLSAEQIQRIKSTVPGAGAIPDDQLVAFVGEFAIKSATKITETNNALAELQTKYTAATALAKAADPEVASGHIKLGISNIRHQRDINKITPAQAKVLEEALTVDQKVDGAPNVANYAGGRVMIDLNTAISAFAGTVKQPAIGAKSKVQPIADPNLEGDVENYDKMADSILGALVKRRNVKAALPAGSVAE